MSRFLQLWSEYGLDDYSEFNLDTPIYDHFRGVKFFSGESLKNVFPATQIALKSRPDPPDYMTVGSLEIVSDRLRRFFERQSVRAEFIEIDLIQRSLPVRGQYYFMNILDCIAALDRKRSRFEESVLESGHRRIVPIDQLLLDQERIGDSRLFVLTERILVLIRKDLADALRATGFSGIALKELPEGPF